DGSSPMLCGADAVRKFPATSTAIRAAPTDTRHTKTVFLAFTLSLGLADSLPRYQKSDYPRFLFVLVRVFRGSSVTSENVRSTKSHESTRTKTCWVSLLVVNA